MPTDQFALAVVDLVPVTEPLDLGDETDVDACVDVRIAAQVADRERTADVVVSRSA